MKNKQTKIIVNLIHNLAAFIENPSAINWAYLEDSMRAYQKEWFGE